MALADLSIGTTASFGVLWNEFRGLAGRPEIWSGCLGHGGDDALLPLFARPMSVQRGYLSSANFPQKSESRITFASKGFVGVCALP